MSTVVDVLRKSLSSHLSGSRSFMRAVYSDLMEKIERENDDLFQHIDLFEDEISRGPYEKEIHYIPLKKTL